MRLRTLFHRVFGWRILAGPFAGMHYVGDYAGSLLPSKLLGTYERELHAIVDRLLAQKPPFIVNVGAGEGYYAVGLARRLPSCLIYAFEADEHGRALIAQVAAQNHVTDRVKIGGLCTQSDLATAFTRADASCWLIIDVEGAEDHLLDPVAIPSLARTIVLVELHDFIDATLGERLKQRFTSSHRVEELWAEPRTPSHLPSWLRWLALTPWRERLLHAMDEQRPGRMRWWVLTPKSR